jgi:ATP-dependent DNA helicase RecQ
MIDESEAEEDFKRLQRKKLDALLALAEAHDCRRVRLLAYFGEPSAPGYRCGNCDNCISPPSTWDATEAARKALSCIYRFRQNGGQRFGAAHLIDVLRGKSTDKVTQYGHAQLTTFGIGSDVSEMQWRLVLRQLIALGHLQTEGEFGTLALAASAREVLRGEVPVQLRVPTETKARKKSVRGRDANLGSGAGSGRGKPPPLPLDAQATTLFESLKAWRGEVAREHNLPAYIVFHDATLAEMARERPATLEALGGISGVGAKKLQAYGADLLRVLESVNEQR